MKVKKHKTAGCYLVRQKNDGWEIVLVYKKWSEDNQGWVPPKGHVKKGESLEEAAKRETIEETGYCDFKIMKPLKTLHIEYPWDDGYLHRKSIHYFLAKLSSDKRQKLKQSQQEKDSTVEVKWLKLGEAEEKLLFDDEREILRIAIKALS